jgi:hypothetical protein
VSGAAEYVNLTPLGTLWGLQDKEGKVAYLSKIMAVVGMVLNQPVPANPLKVGGGAHGQAAAAATAGPAQL